MLGYYNWGQYDHLEKECQEPLKYYIVREKIIKQKSDSEKQQKKVDIEKLEQLINMKVWTRTGYL